MPGFHKIGMVGRFASEAGAIFARNRKRVITIEHLFSRLKDQVRQDLEEREKVKEAMAALVVPRKPTLDRPSAVKAVPKAAADKAPAVVRHSRLRSKGRALVAHRDAQSPSCGSSSATTGKNRFYKVRRGDTLRAIARKIYGDPMMYRYISRANGLGGGGSIYAGQELIIPGTGGSEPIGVRKGDGARGSRHVAAARPARRSQKRVAHARWARNVPTEKPLNYSAYEFKLYVVRTGDTLSTIAKHYYGSSNNFSLIKEYNRIARAENLKVGDKLLIPLPKRAAMKTRYALARRGIFR